MNTLTRRNLLAGTAAGAALAATRGLGAPAAGGNLHVGTFRFDVTPPVGHACCGGWIKPVAAVDDPLEAIGFVLLGAGAPIVVCAVDWTGLLNEAHAAWRSALAEAAGTTPDRVAVQCVHQHNAPLVCFDADRLAAAQTDLPRILDRDFHRRCLEAARSAVSRAIRETREVTHVAHGSGRVEQVAANRRIERGPDGRVLRMRGSSCRNPEQIALEEGLIDPWLRTIALYERGRRIVACHYYATHPMSFYGDGRVSSDFVGLARKARQKEDPGCTHLYFTGCAGNIAAGKYNDGSPASRVSLTGRMIRGIAAADASLRPEPIAEVAWRSRELRPAANPELGPAALRELMEKPRDSLVTRLRPAFKLACLRRVERGDPFVLSSLRLNAITALHLPAEPFIEFQLAAQAMRAGQPVAVAAYGDAGPWYIPTKTEFPAGGYEVEHAFLAPGTDDQIRDALRALLA
jgi:hypothetical protein